MAADDERETPPVSPFRTARQREAEKVTKRDALLLAAVKMFNLRGFTATSLDDVAISLGVTKPVIYYHLGNKDQVLLECLRRGLDQIQQAVQAASDSNGTTLERLRAFLVCYGMLIVSDFGTCVVRTDETALSAESAQTFRELKRGIDVRLRELIAVGIADGSVAPTDVRLAAFTLAGAINWTATWFDESGPMSADAMMAEMVGILLRGLRPR